jgi:mono/diheme cytochrome c family protein
MQCVWTMLVVVLVGVSFSNAAELVPASPRIPGYERFYTAADADRIAGGRLLLSELNCLSCHKAGAEILGEAIAAKKAPVLDDIGDRVRPAWIREFLAAPHTLKSGTTMPDVLSASDDERTQQVEALVHVLASTGSVADSAPDRAAVQRGKSSFHKFGCTACHNPVEGEPVDLPTSVPLSDLGKKYTAASLAAFLKDPLKARPSGRMPDFPLKDEEFRDIAQYFLKDVQLPPNVRYTVYRHNGDRLPKFEDLVPMRSGECSGFDVNVAGRRNDFAIRFTTNLYIRAPAQHQFYVGSDDGSRLTIAGEVIVDNDGIHAHEEVKGRHSFEVGWHPVIVDYFQGGGETTLEVFIDGNGLKRQPLGALVSLTTDKPPEEAKGFVVDTALAEKGRGLFASLGCASCHEMKLDGRKLGSTRTAKAWNELSSVGGCLAEPPVAGLPQYRLTAGQRTALAAVLGKAAAPEQPAELVHRTLVTFNCYACHGRGVVGDLESVRGGVEEARNAFFQSSQKEMGDEGRLPPTLTGVGDKLTDAWMKQLLEQGANDRQHYMQAKMPKFGGRNVGHLPGAFAVVDRQPDSAPTPEFPEADYRIKAAGRHLVGGNALSCIKCHDFGPHPSQGVRAINLATMTKRLRPDWFHRYMLEPQAYRPGTRMPAPWPFGRATVKEVLNANVDLQVRATWRYLLDGDKAAVPVGLVREPIELKPQNVPVIYRNFIEGAGTRAIGVGYPEQANLAWDANDMRLALIWHGAFIDASRHWNGRGQGFESPLGDDVLQLPDDAPFARLASLNDPWPKGSARDHGYQFRGYKLDEKQQPSFQYTLGSVAVEEFAVPLLFEGSKYPRLQRTLTVTGGDAGEMLHFRAARGKIANDKQGLFNIDGTWTLKVSGGEAPILRESNGQQELLVPVKLNGAAQRIALEYIW